MFRRDWRHSRDDQQEARVDRGESELRPQLPWPSDQGGRTAQFKASCLIFCKFQASVKNFQIVSESCPEEVVMQFGKVGADIFTMDFRREESD